MDTLTTNGISLTFDFIKYITTLDTGMIVILATLLEAVLKKSESKTVGLGFFQACVLLLCLSILGSLTFMGLFSAWSLYKEFKWPAEWVTVAFVISILGFVLGLMCFGAFTLKNFTDVNFNSKTKT